MESRRQIVNTSEDPEGEEDLSQHRGEVSPFPFCAEVWDRLRNPDYAAYQNTFKKERLTLEKNWLESYWRVPVEEQILVVFEKLLDTSEGIKAWDKRCFERAVSLTQRDPECSNVTLNQEEYFTREELLDRLKRVSADYGTVQRIQVHELIENSLLVIFKTDYFIDLLFTSTVNGKKINPFDLIRNICAFGNPSELQEKSVQRFPVPTVLVFGYKFGVLHFIEISAGIVIDLFRFRVCGLFPKPTLTKEDFKEERSEVFGESRKHWVNNFLKNTFSTILYAVELRPRIRSDNADFRTYFSEARRTFNTNFEGTAHTLEISGGELLLLPNSFEVLEPVVDPGYIPSRVTEIETADEGIDRKRKRDE